MADTLPRNIVFAFIVVVFILTAGIFIITKTYSDMSITTPESIESLNTQLVSVNSSINELTSNLEGQFNNESKKGFVSKACTSLLGDDNFFCAGLDTLKAMADTPSRIKITIDIFKKSFPISIPLWIYATFQVLLISLVVFVLISAYRRYVS